MTELKTLKDIYNKHNREIESEQYWMMAFLEFNADLKQEAIKWVKELENIIKYRGEYFKDRAESERRVIVFIKQFFNITEEDLK